MQTTKTKLGLASAFFKNLWENRELLDQKRINADLTESVLKKEKEGIEMIVDKIKQKMIEDDCSKRLSEAKIGLTKQTFLRQRIENSKKMLKVNYPKNTYNGEMFNTKDKVIQRENDFDKRIKDISDNYLQRKESHVEATLKLIEDDEHLLD